MKASKGQKIGLNYVGKRQIVFEKTEQVGASLLHFTDGLSGAENPHKDVAKHLSSLPVKSTECPPCQNRGLDHTDRLLAFPSPQLLPSPLTPHLAECTN